MGLPLDATDISSFSGGSTCSGNEKDPADALICSFCRCPTYAGAYNKTAKCMPCLFNVRDDPSESVNLAEDVEPGGGGASAARLVAMTARLLALKKTAVVVPYPPSNFSAACDAMRAAGGFFVPRAA